MLSERLITGRATSIACTISKHFQSLSVLLLLMIDYAFLRQPCFVICLCWIVITQFVPSLPSLFCDLLCLIQFLINMLQFFQLRVKFVQSILVRYKCTVTASTAVRKKIDLLTHELFSARCSAGQ